VREPYVATHLSLLQAPQHELLPLPLVVLMAAEGRGVDVIMIKQLACVTCVLSKD
jgi:hypothetical protein